MLFYCAKRNTRHGDTALYGEIQTLQKAYMCDAAQHLSRNLEAECYSLPRKIPFFMKSRETPGIVFSKNQTRVTEYEGQASYTRGAVV